MAIETARLLLRPWLERDRTPFAALSCDREVMRYLLPLPRREASDAWIDRQIGHQAAHGYCFWAVEAKDNGAFVGAIGLMQIGYAAHFAPAVEVGWRVSRAFWGAGLAVEAAAASLRFGFDQLGLAEIVANTVPDNARSQRVMERLGMSRDAADDFEHPRIPADHPLRWQILYRITRPRWLAGAGQCAATG